MRKLCCLRAVPFTACTGSGEERQGKTSVSSWMLWPFQDCFHIRYQESTVCKQFSYLSRRNGNTPFLSGGDQLALVEHESQWFLTTTGYHAKLKGSVLEDQPTLTQGQSSNISFIFGRSKRCLGGATSSLGFGSRISCLR